MSDARQDIPDDAIVREDVRFAALDGTILRGWLYRPERRGDGPAPLVVVSHGFMATIDMGLDGYARPFAQAGLCVLVYDHRSFGLSDGEPRREANPWQQVSDMRDAISFGADLPGVDADRIGIWGTSYSGGHVLVVGATDRRVKAVVSMVPLVDGYSVMRHILSAGEFEAMQAGALADRAARARGESPVYLPIAAPDSETWLWASAASGGAAVNECSLQSRDMFLAYRPEGWIDRIAPTPLLYMVARNDTRTPTQGQLAAYQRALEPKQFEILEGGHYCPYQPHTAAYAVAVNRSTAFFCDHLRP